jgi:DNA-binding NtrC family response regulator
MPTFRVTVLLVEVGRALATALAARQCRVVLSGFGNATNSIGEHCPAAVVVALDGATQGVDAIRRIRQTYPELCLLALPSLSTEELILAAFRAGVTDYLSQPGTEEELAREILKHCDVETLPDGETMIGRSEEMLEIRGYIQKLAASDSNVLITGETGTGKELVADRIHRSSNRATHPMICVNCAAIPDTLLESELFGFERGAFTGAHVSTPGKIEMANGGTVFFDEIGELSGYAQARLLRVIEEKRIHRLGGHKQVALNIRIVAATNRDLDALAMDYKFRRDLYFRLNVGRIHIPPLRERKLDIPALLDFYTAELSRQFSVSVNGIDPELVQHLLSYTWPGNIRELKNLLEGVFVRRPSSRITFFDLPDWFRKRHPLPPPGKVSESDRLLSVLHETNWNKSQAAGKMHWSRMTLYRKMAKYGLRQEALSTPRNMSP